MSKPSLYVASVLAALAIGPGLLVAQEGRHPPALDAEIETTYTTPGGRTYVAAGHYYRSRDGKIREDSPVGTVITDVRTGTITLLNPATKEARVFVIAGRPPASPGKGPGGVEPFQEAEVDGFVTTKARGKGPRGELREVWTVKDLALVVLSRSETQELTVTRALRHLSLREPDPAMFQIPKDYRVIRETVRPEPPGDPRAATSTPPAPRE